MRPRLLAWLHPGRRHMVAALALVALLAMAWGAIALRQAEIAAAEADALRGRRVAIDPGHGCIDAGASGFGVRESDVVLAVSVKLGDLLAAAGAQALVTRTPQTDCSQFLNKDGRPGKYRVAARMAEIKAWGPDVLVNVHANSFVSGPGEHGAQVFYSPRGGEGSATLAAITQAELATWTGETSRKPNSSIIHYMLEESPVPAVTVEIGFLSNRREAALLHQRAYQEKLAKAMYTALAHWFQEVGAGGGGNAFRKG
ncbi:MAG TPA: N-acetylmuramoyl-L-alanine amidase [Bacillota bacterium]|nr:N-acetylmuramoyl-L-alanine amidase [Bacillota bacterium]